MTESNNDAEEAAPLDPTLDFKPEGAMPKRHVIFIVVSVFLFIAGLFLIIYGAIDYESKKKEKKEDRVGVVIDAGGSGTRMIVYSYANESVKQLKYQKCESTGLANYKEASFPMLKTQLSACLADGIKLLNRKNKQVPIYFAATAGMRLLQKRDPVQYRKVWALINEVLDKSDFKKAKNDTITGFQEGKWAWVAANYLKKSIQDKKSPKYGIIDFGSSSIQMAFEQTKNVSLSEPDVQIISINGYNTTIYGHSYLCFGVFELERRFLAKLVKQANYTAVVKNPCYHTGYKENFTSSFLWKVPCSSGTYASDYLGEDINGPKNETYSIEGSSNFTQCEDVLNKLINTSCSRTGGLCGMLGEYQPKLEGNYFALSTFYYINKNWNDPSTPNKTEFYNKAKALCGKPWNNITKGDKYVSRRCFHSSYGYFLLAKTFKFDDKTWKTIQYANKIGVEKLSWSLGLIYTVRDDMLRRFEEVIKIVKKPSMIALMVLGPLCLILGVFLVYSAQGKKSVDTSPE